MTSMLRALSLACTLIVACSSSSFAAKGVVAAYPSGCDYFIVKTNGGYDLLEWYGGYDPSQGDFVVGDYESYGMKDIYDVSANSSINVWVEDYWETRDSVMEKYRDHCQN